MQFEVDIFYIQTETIDLRIKVAWLDNFHELTVNMKKLLNCFKTWCFLYGKGGIPGPFMRQ